MYGYHAADEMVGRRLGELLVRSDARNEVLLREFIRSGYRLTDIESNERDRAGRPKAFLNNLVGFVEDGQLRRAWGMRREITERKLLEEQLRQAQKMEAIGRLAGGVAHDFNNLLTAMLGSVELLLGNLGPADPRLDDANDIKAAAARAAGLTRQLLAFSRRQLLRPQRLDLNSVVGDVQRLLRRLISEDIELVTRLAPGLGSVRSDRSQLEQVIVNLVVNARDAMPAGGAIVIETASAEQDEAFARINPDASPTRFARLAVHDTGAGMDADTRAHLFEPFFTTKEVGKGTGLGLATVYGIVKQSGGYITVDSQPGRGTTFRIYLPLADTGDLAEREEETRRLTPPGGLPSRNGAVDLRGRGEVVLVVEDEERIRVSAKRILEHYGYRVLLATDGQDALDVLRKGEATVDLVLSDVVMPRMSGPQLYDRLRGEGAAVRFLFTSGYVGKDSRSKLLVDPSVPFLPKPWTVEELVSRVREILDAPVPAR
jgi:signal transduction histidine kinase